MKKKVALSLFRRQIPGCQEITRDDWDFERYANEKDELVLKLATVGGYLAELDVAHGEFPPEPPPWLDVKNMSAKGLARRIKTQPEMAGDFTERFALSHDPGQFDGIKTANFYPALRALGVMRILHYYRWKDFLAKTDDVPPVFLRLDPHKERAHAREFFQRIYGPEKQPLSWPTAAYLARASKMLNKAT